MTSSSNKKHYGRLALAEKMLQSSRGPEVEAGLQLLFDLLHSDPENPDIYKVIFRAIVAKPSIANLMIRKLEIFVDQGNLTAIRALAIIKSGELDEISPNIQVNDDVENIVLLSRSVHRLTPDYLLTSVAPFVKAMADLQQLIDELNSREKGEVQIRSITEYSPLTLSLDGVGNAVQIIRDLIVPWRRKNAHELAWVNLETAKEELISHKLINREKALELEKKKIELGKMILDESKPGLRGDEQVLYLVKVLNLLDLLVNSDLEVK